MINRTIIKKIGKLTLPNPQYGDLKLSVMPFENSGKHVSLPIGFQMWERSFNEIISMIPLQDGANQHYVTIDSKFFSKSDFLRREGIHADGNFCVDPNFNNPTWGGTTTETWGGAKYHPEYRVIKDWELPYDIEIPIGDYISDTKGGILCVSTEVGCQAWEGEFYGNVGAEGDFTSMVDQLTEQKKIVFEKDILYFMTSNTPHETLLIDKGKRRTFLRITLNHEYSNRLLPFMKSKMCYK
jgi:hypothetical protein